MSAYDKELVNSRIIEVCDYYLPGDSRKEGQNRYVWCCPVCDSDGFTASTQKQCAGCFSPGCDVPRTKDAIGIIGYFEKLDTSGDQFIRCLQKGYEILGIPQPENDSGTAPSKGADSPDEGTEKTPTAPPGGEGTPPAHTEHGPTSNTAVAEPESSPAQNYPGRSFSAIGASISSLALLQDLQNGSAQNDSAQNGSSETSSPQEQEEGNGSPNSISEDAEQHRAELDPAEYRELVDRVYRAFLELCPLIERDREWWHSRGVNDETIEQGGFGSIWREHCYKVLPELERRFGREAMSSVPGFYVSQGGRVHTNLYDDYTLIPYYDRDGYITTVEGRVPGQPEGDKPKYVAPVNSGLHLYVFPGYKPEGVMAFCEGAVAAIVAAQSGIPVAAIKGYQHYRIAGGRGEKARPLPEHAHTHFGGRKVRYIPDEDVKPKTKKSVEAEAPKAAKALIADHGGTPSIARLPEGYKDLDEWLLDHDTDERTLRFAELMKSALTPEQYSGKDQSDDGQTDDGETEKKERKEAKKQKKSKAEVYRTQERTDDDTGEESSTGEEGSGEPDEESPGEENTSEQSEFTRVKTAEAHPRSVRPVPITNIGEFMIGLFSGAMAGIGFLLLAAFAVPTLVPSSLLAAVPIGVKGTLLVSLLITAAVLVYVCHRLKLRREMAIREHLAGQR